MLLLHCNRTKHWDRLCMRCVPGGKGECAASCLLPTGGIAGWEVDFPLAIVVVSALCRTEHVACFVGSIMGEMSPGTHFQDHRYSRAAGSSGKAALSEW
jgi:hypothetical protein